MVLMIGLPKLLENDWSCVFVFFFVLIFCNLQMATPVKRRKPTPRQSMNHVPGTIQHDAVSPVITAASSSSVSSSSAVGILSTTGGLASTEIKHGTDGMVDWFYDPGLRAMRCARPYLVSFPIWNEDGTFDRYEYKSMPEEDAVHALADYLRFVNAREKDFDGGRRRRGTEDV